MTKCLLRVPQFIWPICPKHLGYLSQASASEIKDYEKLWKLPQISKGMLHLQLQPWMNLNVHIRQRAKISTYLNFFIFSRRYFLESPDYNKNDYIQFVKSTRYECVLFSIMQNIIWWHTSAFSCLNFTNHEIYIPAQ